MVSATKVRIFTVTPKRALLLVVVQEQLKPWKAKIEELISGSSSPQVQEDIENPLPPVVEPERPNSPAGDLKSPTLPDMIILFVSMTCGVGGTLTTIYNLGQVGRALGYPPSTTTTFISLDSTWIHLGRIVFGVVFETFLPKNKFPLPLMCSLVLFLSCFGHLLIAFGVPNSLFVASVIIGFFFGAQLRLLFGIISDIFGLKCYSTLYTFGALASLVGMFILNINVVGRLYTQEALKQMEAKGLKMLAGEDLTCTGVECYKKSFIVIIAVTLFGCVASLVLALKTKKLYRKFREQATAKEVANVAVQLTEVASDNAVAGSASTNSYGSNYLFS